MSEKSEDLRSVSDTARWVAVYRAIETERADAHFRDPLARRLAGEQGERILDAMPRARRVGWSFVARTVLFDRDIEREIAAGADVVVNLAAGLDARPYRMNVPASLQWIEVDLPEILAYKTEVLKGETPRCRLERIACDLSHATDRRELFNRLSLRGRHIAVVCEGLLVYLQRDDVAAFATDVASVMKASSWIIDLATPALLKRMQKSFGARLDAAAAPLRFAPGEGLGFFEPMGWEVISADSMLHATRRLNRLPWYLAPFALLPPPKSPPGNRLVGSWVARLHRT